MLPGSFVAILCLGLLLPRVALAAYNCKDGEAVGEVQGDAASICAPRCDSDSTCSPAPGVTAQAQCMLKDTSEVAYCGLLCTVDSQCQSGATCKKVGSPEVSLCMHPLSFKDWANTGRTRMTVGWPAKTGQSTRGFKLAKAYAALQSLKRRYGIADGDVDVLTVKELLSVSSTKTVGAQMNAALHSGSGSSKNSRDDMSLSAYGDDIRYFMNNMARGLPGIEAEIHDVEWDLTHLNNWHVCSELFRATVLFSLVYFGGGALYKYQMGARGVDMIPHVGFWMEYPSLVMDGVTYAMAIGTECLGGRPVTMMGKSGGASGDRDTFAHFEPSK